MSQRKNSSAGIKCPICGKKVEVGDEEFPFCSGRCRTIDLGNWASGAYRISSPVLDPEVLENLEDLEEARRRISEKDMED